MLLQHNVSLICEFASSNKETFRRLPLECRRAYNRGDTAATMDYHYVASCGLQFLQQSFYVC